MKVTILKTLLLAAAAAIAFAGAVHAADDHPHDAKSQHGGVVSVVKDVNYELVAKDGDVALYITDHGKPVDLAGATGKLTLLSGSKKQEIALAPSDNALRAKGAFTVPAGTKASAAVQLKSKPPATARFTVK